MPLYNQSGLAGPLFYFVKTPAFFRLLGRDSRTAVMGISTLSPAHPFAQK